MANTEEHIIGAEEGRATLSSALFAPFDLVRARLEALADAPPQVIMLEGGTADERFAMAMWWAARLNCEHAVAAGTSGAGDDVASSVNLFGETVTSSSAKIKAPCLNCQDCMQVATQTFRDLHILDGRGGVNIKMDDVLKACATILEAPVGDGYRVIILAEAQYLGEAAANAMLKSLEEPRPRTSFVLLTPQRERLLPTLVSRSWVLTLPWPKVQERPSPDIEEWLRALASFAHSGQGWFARTGARGAVDAVNATAMILACEAALMTALKYQGTTQELASTGTTLGQPSAVRTLPKNANGLVELLCTALAPRGLAIFDEALAHCSESLALQPSPVNPSLVLDWLATRLYLIVRHYPAGR
ncbi:MAG: DNA polymerase III subunit delta' [Pseudomonadota bacterium]